jgi:multisubunit Na+/H+ antiporter MnhE subunit
MTSLSSILTGFIIAIIIGKHTLRFRYLIRIIIGILAMVQVCVVLYEMFTLSNPMQ